LVFLVKPTDSDCLNDQEQTGIQPPGVIDVQRVKNATVILQPPTNCTEIEGEKKPQLLLVFFLFD